jgi:hypothetical protein
MSNTNHNRRDFLKTLSAGTAAALAAGAPRTWAGTGGTGEPAASAAPAANPEPLADQMILLWMGGAMSQTESFDPKRMTAYEKGIETKKLLCTFPTIDTAVDNIKFCQGVEHLAGAMDKGTLIRSYVARDYGVSAENLQHIPYQVKFHTGYAPPQTVSPPFLGAWISHVRGPLNPDLPAYVELCRPEDTGNVFLSLPSFSASGFLGAEHGPLVVPDAMRAQEVIRSRIKAGRFEDRYTKWKKLVDASPAAELASSHQREAMLKSMDGAYRLMQSPKSQALDLSLESKETLAQYDTGPFGRGCLLARRMIEAGTRFVEVHVDFENAKGWDTHNDGHNGQAKMKHTIDRPVATLLRELEERGLLKRTLVVLATEFGRAAIGRGSTKVERIEKTDHYGLHGHFAGASSLLMFGGGVKRGFVYGKTSDEFPCETVENPVRIEDLHATIYRIMGVNPKYNVEVEKRPFYVTKDGVGKPIGAVLA